MIHDPARLREVIEELAALPLSTRRAHLADVEEKQGKEAADQLRQALKALWDSRK